MIPSTGSLQPRLSSSTVSMSQMLLVSIPKQLSTGLRSWKRTPCTIFGRCWYGAASTYLEVEARGKM